MIDDEARGAAGELSTPLPQPSPAGKRWLPSLSLSVLLAIAVRLIVSATALLSSGIDAFLAPDSHTYLTPAGNLVYRFRFADGLGAPELFRTPGYPLLLTPGILLHQPVLFALMAQLVLTACLVILMFIAVRRVLGAPRVAALCALLIAVEPTTMLWSLKVMPETLFTLLILLFSVASLRALEVRGLGWPLAAACALSAAVYVKPIAYPLAPLLFLVAVLSRSIRRAGPSLHQSFGFLLVCGALVAPWHVRNARVSGYRGFSTLFDHAVYLSAGGSVLARHEQKPFADVRQELLDAAAANPSAGATRYAAMWKRGWSLLASDPVAYAGVHFQGMARTLFDPGAVEYLRMFGRYPRSGGALVHAVDVGLVQGIGDAAKRFPVAFWSSVVLEILLVPLLIFPIVAAVKLEPCRRPSFFLLALIAAYFVAAAGGVPGSSRFRTPVIPILILMGTFAFEGNDVRNRNARRPGRID